MKDEKSHFESETTATLGGRWSRCHLRTLGMYCGRRAAYEPDDRPFTGRFLGTVAIRLIHRSPVEMVREFRAAVIDRNRLSDTNLVGRRCYFAAQSVLIVKELAPPSRVKAWHSTCTPCGKSISAVSACVSFKAS
jgi:hypothetical protein